MDIVRAKELILILAGGINPITGEILSEYDSCNQVEIVRALYTLLGECENNKKIMQVNFGVKKMKIFYVICMIVVKVKRKFVGILNVHH